MSGFDLVLWQAGRIAATTICLWLAMLFAARLFVLAPRKQDLLRVSAIAALVATAPFWFVGVLPRGTLVLASMAANLASFGLSLWLLRKFAGLTGPQALRVGLVAALLFTAVSIVVPF